MSKRATILTGTAGEHYVAYKLSLLGYPVALTRGGAPTIDLMVGDLSASSVVSIQVKSSSNARRLYKRKSNQLKNHWEWDVGAKSRHLQGDSFFYTFVDLKGNKCVNGSVTPDVFIVPSVDVAKYMDRKMSRYMFWIRDTQKEKYYEAWHFLTDHLAGRCDI